MELAGNFSCQLLKAVLHREKQKLLNLLERRNGKMKRRRFSPEFKDEAVRLVLEQGLTVRQAAADLGIGLSSMQKWVTAHRKRQQANNGEVVSEADMAELKSLRKEVHRLRMERDILKKATAFFARENQ